MNVHSPVQGGRFGHAAGDQCLVRIIGKRNFKKEEQEGEEG